jgi:hypothetical protein
LSIGQRDKEIQRHILSHCKANAGWHDARSLTRVEDWLRAETFAKRTSIPSGLSQHKPPQLSSAVAYPRLCLEVRVTGKKPSQFARNQKRRFDYGPTEHTERYKLGTYEHSW